MFMFSSSVSFKYDNRKNLSLLLYSSIEFVDISLHVSTPLFYLLHITGELLLF